MREDGSVLPHFLPCAFALLRQLFFQCGLSGQDGIDLVVKILDHDLCLEVDLIIVLCTAAVLFLLPVLAHHDERCLNGRHAREHQIEQDEGVRVERLCRQQRVDKHPQNQHAGEGKDERPAARKFGNGVRRPLAEGVFSFSPARFSEILLSASRFSTSSSVISRRMSLRTSLKSLR
jgi:hypothetical protein